MEPSPDQDERVIQDISRKIDRERVLIQGAKALRSSTSNQSVQQKCDTNIREAQKNIEYLEERMRQLQVRKRNSVTTDSLQGQFIPLPESPSYNSSSNPASSPTRNHYGMPGSDPRMCCCNIPVLVQTYLTHPRFTPPKFKCCA